MSLNPIETNVYFSTYTNLNWEKVLENNLYKEIVMDSLRFLVQDNRIILYSFVIMPNHIHLIWEIKENHILQNVQRDFLKFTAQKIRFKMKDNEDKLLDNLVVNASDRIVQIWERNGFSFMLNNSKTIMQKMNYIHNNPVREKWKLAENPEEYYYSSAGYYNTGIDTFEMLTNISSILY